jgi:hypothetical protein
MDEEQFELMYKFPGEEQYLPLHAALDHLYYINVELQQRLEESEGRIFELESKVRELGDKLYNLEEHTSFTHNH